MSPRLELTDDLIERVQRRLADERSEPSSPALARALRAESTALLSDAEMLRLIRVLERELVGAGPLAGLLAADGTTDVVVNGPHDVRVDRGNGWEPATVRFSDEAAVARLARRLAAMVGRRLDDSSPFVDAVLADGTRLHAVLPPLAAAGTCISLRVLRPARDDLRSLQERGSLPGVVPAALAAIVRARLAFLISGGTGSGKTTLLNAVLSAVPATERLVTVEDVEELRPRHPHVLRLVARTANVEGAGAISLRDLVRQALRMRPDRIVVGEVRGAEVADLLTALNTGHDGGGGTVHANSPAEVPARIEALGAVGGLDRAAAHSQLAGAVQVVLQQHRTPHGRRLAEIAVLTRTAAGGVKVVPAVRDGIPVPGGADVFIDLLVGRGVAAPW